jgi:hypothetical protein
MGASMRIEGLPSTDRHQWPMDGATTHAVLTCRKATEETPETRIVNVHEMNGTILENKTSFSH